MRYADPTTRNQMRVKIQPLGAGEGIRTPDPLITNQMLYQLSYASANRFAAKRHDLQTLPAARDKAQRLPHRQMEAQPALPLQTGDFPLLRLSNATQFAGLSTRVNAERCGERLNFHAA